MCKQCFKGHKQLSIHFNSYRLLQYSLSYQSQLNSLRTWQQFTRHKAVAGKLSAQWWHNSCVFASLNPETSSSLPPDVPWSLQTVTLLQDHNRSSRMCPCLHLQSGDTLLAAYLGRHCSKWQDLAVGVTSNTSAFSQRLLLAHAAFILSGPSTSWNLAWSFNRLCSSPKSFLPLLSRWLRNFLNLLCKAGQHSCKAGEANHCTESGSARIVKTYQEFIACQVAF